MSISGCDIRFSQSIRNLGFYLDENLSMDAPELKNTRLVCRAHALTLFIQMNVLN